MAFRWDPASLRACINDPALAAAAFRMADTGKRQPLPASVLSLCNCGLLLLLHLLLHAIPPACPERLSRA